MFCFGFRYGMLFFILLKFFINFFKYIFLDTKDVQDVKPESKRLSSQKITYLTKQKFNTEKQKIKRKGFRKLLFYIKRSWLKLYFDTVYTDSIYS